MPGMRPTMDEFKAGKLHSGSKKGPIVTNRKQAIAIGMNDKKGRPTRQTLSTFPKLKTPNKHGLY